MTCREPPNKRIHHVFGTIKRVFNHGYLLLKGLRKVNGEIGFNMLAYNMRRAINVLGVGRLVSFLTANCAAQWRHTV
ncbi:MAG: hypothetical protein JRN52_01795 [Nitrososphaerota archaeon]|nr:hypothetical protein [Nitrososphaerota archaeon]